MYNTDNIAIVLGISHDHAVPCHAEVMTCHVIGVISLVCHKICHGKRKPGVSDQTYFCRQSQRQVRKMEFPQACWADGLRQEPMRAEGPKERPITHSSSVIS